MPRKGVPYGGGICSLRERIAELFDLVGEKLHSINGVQGDGQGNVKVVSGDDAIVITNDQIGHKIEVSLDTAAAQHPAAGDGIVVNGRTVSLANSGVTAGTYGSNVGVPQLVIDAHGRVTEASTQAIPEATHSASGLMTAAQAVRLDAALPAATPQVYSATIPQTDYLDVCLVQYVRIGQDKGLLSFSGHMRDISLPNDVWTLISIDTIMSAMGLTHKRPSAYRATGWWHYDDGDDHGDKYGSGTVCQVSPSGGLELGRFYSETDIGDWQMSVIGRDRYISVRDVYAEIQSDAQHTHTLPAPAVVPGSQHTFRIHQSYL